MTDDDKLVFHSDLNEMVFKIIVVGDPSVGTTSLLTKFSTKKFKNQYIPTVGVNIVKEQLTLGKNLINLMLWDIAGQRV